MEEDDDRRERRLVTLGQLWLLAVGLYVAWAVFSESGLYYWLATIELDHLNELSPKLTALFLLLALGLPPSFYVGVRKRRRAKLHPSAPVRGPRNRRGLGRFAILFGIIMLAGGVAAFIVAVRMPDGTEPAAPLDAATLRNGPPPTHRVALDGVIDPDRFATMEVATRYSSRVDRWVVFHPRGDAAATGARARFIVADEASGDSARLDPRNFDNPIRGYLIENGLSPLARYALERRGIAIAEPHYLLVINAGDLRIPLLEVGAFALVLGVLGLSLARGLALARRKARPA